MDLIQLVVLIAVVGAIVYFVVTIVPMPPLFKNIIIGLAVGVIGLYLLQRFHLLPPNVLPN